MSHVRFRLRVQFLLACAASIIAVHPDNAIGQCDIDKMTASDGAGGDEFGYAVAIDGDRILVGARRDDDQAVFAGTAFIFRRQGIDWLEEVKLLAPATGPADQFGSAVDLDGLQGIVGAPLHDDGGGEAGTAFVYSFTNGAWDSGTQLLAPDRAADDEFGAAVAIGGLRVVVGARLDDDGGANAGSAYVFRHQSGAWVHELKLGAADAATGDQFGTAVDIDGDFIVVGAPGDNELDSDAGAAYIFRRQGSGWVEEMKLLAGDGLAGDAFGSAVAIKQDRVLIGAPDSDGAGNSSGSVYVFRRDGGTWAQEAKLTALDAAGLDLFGSTLDLDGLYAVVGSPGDGDFGNSSGAAYLFERDGVSWSQLDKITASDAQPGDEFGFGVGVSGIYAVAGAPFNDDLGGSAGAAYALVLEGTDCNTNGSIDACDVAAGTSTDCNSNGVADDCYADTDCDSNSITDACDPDCDGNLIADACEPFTDCNTNGSADFCDIATGTSLDCQVNGTPDECEISAGSSEDIGSPDGGPPDGVPDECAPDCQPNGIADFLDIVFALSDDCDTNGIPDECDPDCNSNGIPDGCDIIAGTSADCDVNGVPDSCDLSSGRKQDCNLNGTPDRCDITLGTSADCNVNLIPDSCDIGEGTSADCNSNAVPDACDLSGGTSADCDTNGLPDDCQTDCNSNGRADVCDLDPANFGLFALDRFTRNFSSVDPADGSLTTLFLLPSGINGAFGLAAHPETEELFALLDTLSGQSLATISRETGTINIIGDTGQPLSDIAFHHSGTLYGIQGFIAPNAGEVLIVDTDTADITTTGIFGNLRAGNSIIFDPGTDVLIHSFSPGQGPNDNTTFLERINVVTGAMSLITPGPSMAGPINAMTFDDTQTTLLAFSFGDFYAIDPDTGADTLLGSVNPTVTGLANIRPSLDCNTNAVPDECELGDDCNSNSVPDECDVISSGDFDADSDRDLTDYAALADCLDGPDSPTSPQRPECAALCLEAFDTDMDNDIDLADFAIFAALFGT